MPLRSDWSHATCPIAHAADVLADPWVLVVLRELFTGRTRFDELRTATGAADSVLARRLHTMTDAGLIEVVEPRGYRLTERGHATLPILHALARFTADTSPDGGWGLAITCGRCGANALAADWCVECAEPLTSASTRWTRTSVGAEPFPLARPLAPGHRG